MLGLSPAGLHQRARQPVPGEVLVLPDHLNLVLTPDIALRPIDIVVLSSALAWPSELTGRWERLITCHNQVQWSAVKINVGRLRLQ